MSKKQTKKPGVLDSKEALKVMKESHPVAGDGQIFMFDRIRAYDGRDIDCVVGFRDGVPSSIHREDIWVSFFENMEFKKIPVTLELAQYILFEWGSTLRDECGCQYTSTTCRSRGMNFVHVVVKWDPSGFRPTIICEEKDFPLVFPTMGPLTIRAYRSGVE